MPTIFCCTLNGRRIELTPDQQVATALGLSRLLLVAIQAAFAKNTPVLVTASTTTAVAQFTETLIALDVFEGITIVRYLADASAAANAPTIPVDLNNVLKRLEQDCDEEMNMDEQDLCRNYRLGRERIGQYLEDPDLIFQMTEDEKKDYIISERFVSNNVEMVTLMFRLRKSNIILATMSSLLNTAGPGGIIKTHVEQLRVLIGDEASKYWSPYLEPLPYDCRIRHIYIGDIHQLEADSLCPDLSRQRCLVLKGSWR
ncbi:unnamed protein product [Cylicocyclus nassatus]|uniref:Uncharacterized protein n=1 Tax=Cylicocyclus nassatus TaxID=53992 RepID=A0AA36MAD9_CYLNA|nr:unnamed protein product [Cylicocyclus nassatus]